MQLARPHPPGPRKRLLNAPECAVRTRSDLSLSCRRETRSVMTGGREASLAAFSLAACARVFASSASWKPRMVSWRSLSRSPFQPRWATLDFLMPSYISSLSLSLRFARCLSSSSRSSEERRNIVEYRTSGLRVCSWRRGDGLGLIWRWREKKDSLGEGPDNRLWWMLC